jgi:hypothetical protein
VHRLAAIVYREEGVTGFYRGLWIPLVTISFVREFPHCLFCTMSNTYPGAASFTIYSGTKEYCRKNNYFTGDRASDAAIAGGLSGALSGSLISFTSARACSYTLFVKHLTCEISLRACEGILTESIYLRR